MIAFTSDFIQKLVYRFHYGDGGMDGYVMFTLSKSPTENWIDQNRVSISQRKSWTNFFVSSD